MNVHNYLIDHSQIDWAKVLAAWHWLLPKELTVWLMSCFGDLFLVLEDGSVHMLDVSAGTLARVANSRDAFCHRIEQGDNAKQWLMMPLVDKLAAAGKTLHDGQCYGYRIPPIVGGDHTVENSCVISIPEHYSFHAYVHEQVREYPDGTQVILDVVNRERQ